MRIKKKNKDGKKFTGLKGNRASRGALSFIPERKYRHKKLASWTPWWFFCLPKSTTRQGVKVEPDPLKRGKWISWAQHLKTRKPKGLFEGAA